MRKKQLLANFIFHPALAFASIPMARALGGNFFYVLAYHRVCPIPTNGYPFEKGTISVSPAEFDRQMTFVKNKFNVVNFHILSDLLAAGKKFPPNSLIVTFDDGFSDNHDIAWDILKKHGLTATIFVATSFVEKKEVFWFEKLTYVINKTSVKALKLESKNHRLTLDLDNRPKARNRFMNLLKTVSNPDRLCLLAQLEERAGVEAPQGDPGTPLPLNWSQVKKMAQGGLEIGSHTVSHPFLANLTDDEIQYELSASKKAIEEKTGKRVKSIAYPFGNHDRRVIVQAEKAGYEFGITYEHNVRGFDFQRRFSIPRIHVEPEVDFSFFQANLLLPRIFMRFGA